MASSSSSLEQAEQEPVLFEENLAYRRYLLNRPKKLNALDTTMIEMLHNKMKEWREQTLCNVIVGSSVPGRAFCAGGDVAKVVEFAANEETRDKAIQFFRREFKLNYILAILPKPYVAIMDGITMGGGVGLAAPAPFRVATEKTVYAMPETKIGYCPDVGASYYLSRLDGEIGTYLALTGSTLTGRAVFEHGIATHYIPSHRVPILLQHLSALEESEGANRRIMEALEELYFDPENTEPPSPLSGDVRDALDSAFSHNEVESIVKALQDYAESDNTAVSSWASAALDAMEERSPTSMKVALMAIRRGKTMNLLQALEMELNIAAAFCRGDTSPDFKTGVTAVLVERAKGRPNWQPSTLAEVSASDIEAKFFPSPKSPSYESLTDLIPKPLRPLAQSLSRPSRWALPLEEEISRLVRGSHESSDSSALTVQELVERVEKQKFGKHGVVAKVMDTVARRCEEDEEGYLTWRY